MKITVKGLLIAMFFTAAAAQAQQQKPFIQTAQQRIVVDKVTASPRGELTYTVSGTSVRLAPDGYIFARVPRPELVNTGIAQIRAKNFAQAVETFDKLYSDFRFLGWDVEAIYFSAFALEKLGKNKEAIDKLNLITEEPKDPEKMSRYYEAKRLLAEIYITEKKLAEAHKVLQLLGGAQSDAIVAFANNKQGDILLLEGKRRDALLMYLRTALLFDKNNTRERPEALGKIVKIFKEDRNNRFIDFEKMFAADYPGQKLPE